MNENKTEKNRLDYMDLAKGIGIICVILGHMGNSVIERIVFSFHMPLFFFISGYFLSRQNTSKEILRKRIKQLIPPYLFTCGVIIMLSIIKNLIGVLINRKTMTDMKNELINWMCASVYGAGSGEVYHNPIGAVWFLLAMITATYIVKKSMEMEHTFLVIFVVALTGYISSKFIWLPWSIQAGMTAAIFVYMGVKCREQRIFDIEEKSLHVGLFGTALIFWINEIIHGNPNMSIVRNCYPNGAFDFIGGGCGTICVIIIARYLLVNVGLEKVWNILIWFGKNSLIILCVHLIEMDFFPYQKVFSQIGIREHLFLPTIILKLFLIISGTFLVQHTVFRKVFDRK